MRALDKYLQEIAMSENFILDAIAADANVAPAFRAAIRPPQFFETRHGFPKKKYLSQSDADKFDAGYASFQSLSDPPPLEFGPFADGWFAAFQEDEERATASLEAHESDVCHIDDEAQA